MQRTNNLCRAMGVALVCGLLVSATLADTIAGVTVAPSTQTWVAHQIIDGSGVDGDKHSTSAQHMWLSGVDAIAGQTLRFDLKEIYDLGFIKLWNYNEPTGGDVDRGINGFTVSVSQTGVPGTFAQVGGSLSLPTAPGNNYTDFAQSFDLSGACGRFVMVTIAGNHGDPQYVGLSEAAFAGTATGTGRNVVPVSISASSELNANRGPENLLGPGLNVYDEHATSHADNQMWQSTATDWADGLATLDFDLGEKKSLAAMRIWNFNEYPADNSYHGVQTMEILVKAEMGDDFISLGTIHPAKGAPVSNRDYSEIFALSANDIQYVQFRITANYGGSYVGLSEVQFIETPEPATLGLLALGGLGILRRRGR